MRQLFLIAIRNLAQHGKRTLLLGGAIAGVTALLVILLSLSSGVQATLFQSATTLMTGHLNVGGFYKITAGQAAPLVTQFRKVEEVIRRDFSGIDYITQRGRGWAKLVSETSSMQVGIGGIDVRNEPGFRKVIVVKDGRLDDLSQPNTILLFEQQAKKLDVKVGDAMTLSAPTPRGTNNTIDVRLVAIAQNVGLLSSWNVFIPDQSLRALYQLNPDTTGAIFIYLKNLKDLTGARERLRNILEKAGYLTMDNDPRAFFMKFETVNREEWTGQKLDITTWEDEISFMKWTLTALNGLTGILTFVLLIIIAIGIMNSMWIAIRERTREIGTLRAIGMQRKRVLAMFVVEGFTLGLLGTVAGALIGILACGMINLAHLSVPVAVQLFVMSNKLHLAVDRFGIVRAIALITASTTLVSLIPSLLAARLKPITAIHHIG